MKAFSTAVTWVLGAWFCIYLLLAFTYLTFDVRYMKVLNNSEPRFWIGVISLIILLAIWAINPGHKTVLQGTGKYLDKSVITSIETAAADMPRGYIRAERYDDTTFTIEIKAHD